MREMQAIGSCSVCGMPHVVRVTEFPTPIQLIAGEYSATWTHYAMCAITGRRILIRDPDDLRDEQHRPETDDAA